MAADREIVSSRVLDAPRERVFEAWTDPKKLAAANEQNFDRLEKQLGIG